MLCLIYTHDALGRAAPEGECGYIRQSTSAWDITNMLHFLYSALLNLPSELSICFSYIVGDTTCDCGFMF